MRRPISLSDEPGEQTRDQRRAYCRNWFPTATDKFDI